MKTIKLSLFYLTLISIFSGIIIALSFIFYLIIKTIGKREYKNIILINVSIFNIPAKKEIKKTKNIAKENN